ncbi:GNAT family protein [Microcoleus asticus]|uniref:GNAT family protein n=1 Tax=Microcoleus asticus TaxID=2815231 RepID=UPI0030DD623B
MSWRRGLGNRSSVCYLKIPFQTIGFDRIVALSKSENIASPRVMAKVGMQYEQKIDCWGAN